jgi:hypothetical protein
MEYLSGSATAADDMISHSSGHLDSPLERKAAMERIRSGQKNATASLFKTDPRLANVPTADADGGVVTQDEKASFAQLRANIAAKRAEEAAFRKEIAYQVAGVQGGGGYFGGRGAFLTSAKDRARNLEGDADGDGHVSLAERFDKDGDVSGRFARRPSFARASNPPCCVATPREDPSLASSVLIPASPFVLTYPRLTPNLCMLLVADDVRRARLSSGNTQLTPTVQATTRIRSATLRIAAACLRPHAQAGPSCVNRNGRVSSNHLSRSGW